MNAEWPLPPGGWRGGEKHASMAQAHRRTRCVPHVRRQLWSRTAWRNGARRPRSPRAPPHAVNEVEGATHALKSQRQRFQPLWIRFEPLHPFAQLAPPSSGRRPYAVPPIEQGGNESAADESRRACDQHGSRIVGRARGKGMMRLGDMVCVPPILGRARGPVNAPQTFAARCVSRHLHDARA